MEDNIKTKEEEKKKTEKNKAEQLLAVDPKTKLKEEVKTSKKKSGDSPLSEKEAEATTKASVKKKPQKKAEVTEEKTEEKPITKQAQKKKTTKKANAEKESEPISTMENQLEMYEKSMKSVQQGNVVQGTIIRASSNEVLVDIGFKSEGVIPISEFKNPEEAKEGSKIWVYIVSKENNLGLPLLSKRKADEKRYWNELEDCFQNNKQVTGKIKNRVTGGMVVDFNGIDGFLPGSQFSTKTLPSLDHLVGKEFDFKIINFDREKENLVVSHKIVVQEEILLKQSKLLNNLKEGFEVDGVVKNIMDYGIFVNLDGMDGLLHISDMSWGHIRHPSEMLKLGDRIKVKVLAIDLKNKRIGLGLKQLVPHPWENIEIKYPEGSKIEGKVTNITSYGAFVELEKGVEGLIHISEMSWTKQLTHPNQAVKVGDTVKAIILNVDKDEHRISLGLKQIEPNPWLTIDVRYPIGAKITGKIKTVTNFGAFMEVEEDIDGLIHISDLSWTKRILHPNEMLKEGQEVTAVILSIDKVMQRIALGIKQLEPDPWEDIKEKLPVNSEHIVEIMKILPKGILVTAKHNLEGFIPTSHLGIPGLQNPQFAFDEDEKLPVKVIEVDEENRRLILSVKTYFFDREEKEVNDFVAEHLAKIKIKRKEAKEISNADKVETKDEKIQEKIKTTKKNLKEKNKKKKEKKQYKKKDTENLRADTENHREK